MNYILIMENLIDGCAKLSRYIANFSPHSNTLMKISLLFLFYKWNMGGIEKLGEMINIRRKWEKRRSCKISVASFSSFSLAALSEFFCSSESSFALVITISK